MKRQRSSPRPTTDGPGTHGPRPDALATEGRPVRRFRLGTRAGAAVVHGSLLLLVLLSYRVQKAGVLRFEGGWVDWLSLLLPEVGAVLVVEAVLLAIPAREGRRRTLWWIAFAVVHLLGYLLAAAEHTFYLHSGIRLHLDLVAYAAENFRMLQGLIIYGVDGGFVSRLVTAGLCLLLGGLLARRVKLKIGRGGLAALFAAGILLLLLPPTQRAVRAELDSSTFFELVEVRSLPSSVLEQARAHQPAPGTLYQAPQLEAAPGPRPPNIVLVMAESTRWDVVPPHSPPETWARTPAFAQLARESWVVDTGYASVTHTSKALVAILCGMLPRLEMAIDETLEEALPLRCLPHLLEDAGYRTAFLQTAFGIFENRPGLVRNLGFSQAAFQETLDRPGFATTGYLGIDEVAMLEPAVSWSANGGDSPFFLTMLTLSPHHPYEVPGGPPVSGLPRREAYDATIAHLDRFLGALLSGLRSQGLLENTVVIVLGDHGEAFGEHRRMQHDIVPYEEVVRIPWMMRLPPSMGEAMATPRRVEGLRSHLDLLPTVLELADVEWRGTLPGRSLLSTAGHDQVTISCWFTDTCLSRRERTPTGDRKIVYHYRLRPIEVFDLALDPGEDHNLAEAMSEDRLEALEAQLLGWKLGVDAFWERHPPGPDDDLLWWQRQPPSNPMPHPSRTPPSAPTTQTPPPPGATP